MIKCPICFSRTNEYNEQIGETCCADCGLVLTSIAFEETTFVKKDENINLSYDERKKGYVTDNGNLGSRIKGTSKLAKTQLFASSKYKSGRVLASDRHFTVLVKNILYQYNIPTSGVVHSALEQCESLKRTLREKNMLVGYSTEIRASSITYLILRHRNITNIKRHATICGVNIKMLKKTNKKFSKGIKTKEIIQIRNPTLMMENSILMLETNIGEICNQSYRIKCFKMCEYVASCYDELNLTYRNSTNALVMWLVSQIEGTNYTQKEIGNASNTTPQSLRINLKQFYQTFNINKQQLLSISVEDFISGIRGR
tara:strand:- start:273 stop:1211 length:939 start_codon:yes stop_codon:yes gene_type:complete